VTASDGDMLRLPRQANGRDRNRGLGVSKSRGLLFVTRTNRTPVIHLDRPCAHNEVIVSIVGPSSAPSI
jgi:hypothetical protein